MTTPATSLDEARKNLGDLILRSSPLGDLSNEAETRFHFLDELLMACLGWDKGEIHVEISEASEFADYELGDPREIIWEAKRAGHRFSTPVRTQTSSRQTTSSPIHSLPSLMLADDSLRAALEQCLGYCNKRGVPYGVVSNGHQIIAFLASRTDGVAPLKGKALVIDGESQLLAHFGVLWQHLSRPGVKERRLTQLLSAPTVAGIPRKLSSFLFDYPRIRYRNQLQDDLRTVADLLLEDLTNVPELEEEFYRNCYCESGALSSFAMSSKQVLAARYSALFSAAEDAPSVASLSEANAGSGDQSEIVAQALSKRPIVLLGDVGVGKTSFLKNLIHVQARGEFSNALYIYIDLGSQGALDSDLQKFILHSIEAQLFDRYKVDIQEFGFVRGVYDLEVKRFQRGIWGDLKERNPEQYAEKLRDYLGEQLANTPEHVRRSVQHIARGRRKPVVLIIDNADQRDLDTQQRAFVIAQNFAKEWDAIVFIAVRPQTFHQSKRAGALSAYPPKVFTISPPRPELLVRKRLEFALSMAEGRLPVEKLQGITLNMSGLACFLKALLYSLERNRDILELLSNITGGNMRAVVELVTRFISTPNVDADKIIDAMERTGHYYIPVHEFAKVAILGDYAHYNPESSIAANLFDVGFPDQREHFLSALILSYLDFAGPHRTAEEFVRTDTIVREMQDLGFVPHQTHSCLRRLTNKRLLETTERVTFEEDALRQLVGDLPSAFRITSVGAYHIKRWIGTFAYLDAMAFDTPIFSEKTGKVLLESPESFGIGHRLERATAFRSYLTEVWMDAGLVQPYFDWGACVRFGSDGFEQVERFISRRPQ